MPQPQRTIHVWAEDKPGVLIRVANTVTSKGANIDRIVAGPDPVRSGISKITVVATLDDHLHQRVVNEINRLVNVLVVIDVTGQHRSTVAASVRQEAVAC
jgi:acetolactate synthase-1/3 small subunit